MTSNNPNKTPGDEGGMKSDANKQPSVGPKRVIHLSKPLSDFNENNNGAVPALQRDPASPNTEGAQAETSPAAQSESYAESAEPESIPARGDRTVPQLTDKKINPGLRLRALLSGGKTSPPQKPPVDSQISSSQSKPNLVVWYIAIGVSLLINAILVVALVGMSRQVNGLKTSMDGLVSGLYGNFMGLDNSSLNTTITVDAQVPVNFMVPIQQNTDVVLTESLAIPGAKIVINSGGLSINAPANITLPAGTNLPVALNIAVPVQFTVPITLQIPVNIPLSQTGLHQPIAGLQDTVKAYYCSIDKNAQYPDGIYLCENHENPTATAIAP